MRRKTFNEIVRETAETATHRLFLKARLASDVAKAALDRKGTESAYKTKIKSLDAAIHTDTGRIRRFKDFNCGRWVYRFGNQATHGSKIV